ncbi:hypothetical protein JCM11491_000555 [Sporobolomyces phaffii]
MGKFVVSTWARLLGLTSASYVLWASLWALYHRKLFWDFIGGHLGPHGVIPSPKAGFLVKVIVDYPVVQLVNLILAVFLVALEYPVPFGSVGGTGLARSIRLRVAVYLVASALAGLVYQSVDGGVFYLITGVVYVVSARNGDEIGGSRSR